MCLEASECYWSNFYMVGGLLHLLIRSYPMDLSIISLSYGAFHFLLKFWSAYEFENDRFFSQPLWRGRFLVQVSSAAQQAIKTETSNQISLQVVTLSR